MICSVLIPSRNRFDALCRCIRSVYSTCSNEHRVEVFVRFHSSDLESVRRAESGELHQINRNVRYFAGADYLGYDSLGRFYEELTERVSGDWHWQFNDDFELIQNGEPWDRQLLRIPMEGFLVQPENHLLNSSHYHLDEHCPAPLYPAGALEKLGLKEFPVDIDIATHRTLVIENGWKVEYLKGLTLYHNRKIDATLPVERF